MSWIALWVSTANCRLWWYCVINPYAFCIWYRSKSTKVKPYQNAGKRLRTWSIHAITKPIKRRHAAALR